jgi:hypothetical protein
MVSHCDVMQCDNGYIDQQKRVCAHDMPETITLRVQDVQSIQVVLPLFILFPNTGHST